VTPRYGILERDGIRGLDQALYVASCFASHPGGVTVQVRITSENTEIYRVVEGDIGPQRDNEHGWDWEPVYHIERRGR